MIADSDKTAHANLSERDGLSYREGFGLPQYFLLAALSLVIMIICIAFGSVNIPLLQTSDILWCALSGQPQADAAAAAIILTTRLPRVISVALVGAALSIGGAAMQGLLKNPLADGSTLGVSGGASLGAVIAIVLGVTIPGLPFGGTVVLAMLCAFLSLLVVLGLAYRIDYSMSTNTIILLGIIFSMFTSSIVALFITFAGDHLRSITFWLMGSFSGASFTEAALIAVILFISGLVILCNARELNAFAIGEDNARHVGVNVRRVKLLILIAVAALVGVCVSVSGAIGFVGLVTPHMLRLIVGPNHKRLLPASLFGGAGFLMLADLVARVLLSPRELPIGVVTSFVGAIVFVSIFYRMRSKTR